MDKLTDAFSKVHDALSALSIAITELEIQSRIAHDRLRRILDQYGSDHQEAAPGSDEQRLSNRPQPLDYIAWGDTIDVSEPTAHDARERAARSDAARAGVPTELRDII